MPIRNDRVTKKNIASVLNGLRKIRQELPSDQKELKIYHEGRYSFSWDDLIAEIEAGSETGTSYVAKIVNAAKEEKLSVDKYLKSEAA